MRLAVAAVLAVALALAQSACAITSGDHTGEGAAPLVGIDGSADQADRNCHVVLRGFARMGDGTPFGYQTNSDGSWKFAGTIDISAEAAAEGLVPSLVYHVGHDPFWLAVTATPSDAEAPVGFVRFDVHVDQGMPGPGWDDLTTVRVELVPLLTLDGGGRMFDHNRNPGDFDNYSISWDRDFQITAADAVCPAVTPTPPARVVFHADHSEEQIGGIVPGGELRVEYDVNRLTTCRHSQGGNPLWDINAHVRWEPSGELTAASVRDGAATFTVPIGATRVALWFENTSASGCQAWDSNFGANYPFDVLAPPVWAGNTMVRISRDTDDPCTGGGGIDGFQFGTWARQRAAYTNACVQVYQPGVTDVDGIEVWRRLDVSVRWRGAGTDVAYRSEPVSFDRRIGNDARFAFNLRTIDPFRPYHCPDVPTEPSSDPQYIHADIELYFVINGLEVRSTNGHPFVGTFENYADENYCP